MQHFNENPLVVIQLDVIQLEIVNAYPSADRQAQFDVLVWRTLSLTTASKCNWEMTSPILLPYYYSDYWSYFDGYTYTYTSIHIYIYIYICIYIYIDFGCFYYWKQ